MFQVGDFVVRINEGVCKITEIRKMQLFPSTPYTDYYIMVPVKSETIKLYLPTDYNGSDIRPVLTKTEADDFLKKIPGMGPMVLDETRKREEQYKTEIRSLSLEKMVGIIKCVQLRTDERLGQGKKTTVVDDRYSALSLELLKNELSFVYDISKEQMGKILEKVGIF